MELLTFPLNTESRIPLYHQLYSYLKAEIQNKTIGYNTKLPSKRKLSSHLGISQNTIQSAYDQLIEEGYVVSTEKKGYYVAKIDHLQKLTVLAENEYAVAAQPVSEVKYDFSYHGVDHDTFPFRVWRRLTKELVSEYDPEFLKQGDSQGYLRLRKAIADYLHQSRGVNCTEDQIIISSGTEILFQSLIQLLDRESIYGIENPGYEKLNQLFTANRSEFVPVALDAYGMNPESVVISKANILCLSPAHQFPSGEIMPISRRIQLLNWANEAPDRYLIEDDYDSEFKYSGKPIPALQGLDTGEKVIYMGSLSKSLTPTLRVSYMVLPLHLLQRYLEKLSYILCPVPVLEQKTLCSFIEQGYFERHLNKMRTVYKKKRDILVKEIAELRSGTEIHGADAGLHLLLQIPNTMTEDELISAAYEQGVKVYGISKYYTDKSNLRNPPTLLLGFATMGEEDIREAVLRLKKAWFAK